MTQAEPVNKTLQKIGFNSVGLASSLSSPGALLPSQLSRVPPCRAQLQSSACRRAPGAAIPNHGPLKGSPTILTDAQDTLQRLSTDPGLLNFSLACFCILEGKSQGCRPKEMQACIKTQEHPAPRVGNDVPTAYKQKAPTCRRRAWVTSAWDSSAKST